MSTARATSKRLGGVLEAKEVKKQKSEPTSMVELLLSKLADNANTDYASAQQKYMKAEQFFYGLKAPLRSQLLKESIAEFPPKDFPEFKSTVDQLWKGKSRDEMYCAMELCKNWNKPYKESEMIPLMESMIKTCVWWDQTDSISPVFGRYMLKSKKRDEYEDMLRSWATDTTSFWIRRASLYAQIPHKKETNKELLKEVIVPMIPETEFFIQKAIGTVLREYSKSNAKWVKKFVKEHEDELSKVTLREAKKYI
eukprot:TRINITY_DN5012_c0_g1_i1.p1 TRINITY_DN5012_c0_g1~~TRINITY_DN5012_c0_g1_i1.p1  ORF type:complete len:253 (-),score=66.27 TRINITY_DN5012_c0_g1_i1:44-802(-)